ncbi:D-alanyl-D-alanine carboxypeptidase family protein [Zhenhengia yiwuensis]|uniref:D-alanyl-D-alanine carboxypeptidase family protein n=1 Tax=Zhenhengia yiwuensis TaxID=2763666 RepID=UPI002A749806|nr:D-alanyl-D-alanine carboxypeptidase family protein [Zhenhengia yiwuensis]MDY3367735.1 D-alanyl-D-alanine carboxypeptidase family protein [Zhenhengia yiwuensis]
MKKKFGISLLITLLLSSSLYASEVPGTIYSKGSVLIEKESKRVLYEKNAHEKMAMASTTKIMTCIVAIESGKLDEIVTVSGKAARAPKVKLNLKTGEKQKLGDLLYSLMLESHNDTAVAIAEHVGGSVEEFCAMMTEKAKAIGAENTCFETPNGLDGQAHYSTPYDMALIAAYALDNPEFVKIINTPQIEIPTTQLEGSKKHVLINKNRFLSQYEGAEGVKTGYTSKAGHCFVGAVKKEDMELIGVALGAGWDSKGKSRKYTDVIKLMNYGYNNYKKYKVLDKGEEKGSVKVTNGKVEDVILYVNETVILPLTEYEKETIELKKTVTDELQAPIDENQVVGKVEVICDGKVLKKVDLLASQKVDKANLLDKLKRFFQK